MIFLQNAISIVNNFLCFSRINKIVPVFDVEFIPEASFNRILLLA